MACLQFGVPFTLVANTSTAKTNVGVKTPAQQAVKALGLKIGFDGTTSTTGPAIVEFGTCTFATNAPGTNSTSVTPGALDSGRPETIQSTAGKNWTTEPTVITITDTFNVQTYMGSGIQFFPLTMNNIAKGGNGFVVRVTLPSGVSANASGCLLCEE